MNVSPGTQKLILSLLILSALGFVVYSTLFTELEVPLDLDGNPVISNVVGQDLIILADKLESVEIKRDLFSSSLFTNLVDITVPVEEEVQGRINPFSSIGTD